MIIFKNGLSYKNYTTLQNKGIDEFIKSNLILDL